MGDYVVYVLDEGKNSKFAVEVPMNATVIYFLDTVLINTTNQIIFGEVVLNDLNPNETLADIGLCPESTVIISMYITQEAFCELLMNFIGDNVSPEVGCRFHKFINNPNVTPKFIKEQKEMLCPNVKIQPITKNNDSILWDYIKDVDDINKFFDNNTKNEYIIEEFSDKYISNYGFDDTGVEWYWDVISIINCLPTDFIKKNIDKLNIWNISYHPNLTFDIVLNNLNKKWCWVSLTQHQNITFDIVSKHRELFWCTDRLSFNPNITADIIENNPEYPWNYTGFLCNVNITMNWILQNKEILLDTDVYQQKQLYYTEFKIDRMRLCGY